MGTKYAFIIQKAHVYMDVQQTKKCTFLYTTKHTYQMEEHSCNLIEVSFQRK